MEMKQQATKGGKHHEGKDDEDDGEGNADMKLFAKKKSYSH